MKERALKRKKLEYSGQGILNMARKRLIGQ
jgi:hypothetical protein